MLIPGVLLVLYFSYVPIAGNVIAFMNYQPLAGLLRSKWVGFSNFSYLFKLPGTFQIIWNTVYIATMKIVLGLVFPIALTLLMNEVASRKFKRTLQTLIYIPHFMSWIILSGIFLALLSLNGPLNTIIKTLGFQPVYFLGNNAVFPFTMAFTDTWKETGFSTIIYMAALTSIDPSLFESAEVDGANRWQMVWHISLPGILPIIILMGTLSLGNILNAGFEQIFTLYSPQVYKSGDIIDTFVYRLGMIQAQYGPATAMGLFKSVISFGLISLSYFLASKFANYQIF